MSAEREDLTENEEVAVEPIVYPGSADDDEQRRAFVLEQFAGCASDMTEEVFVAFLKLGEGYLKDGTLPAQRRPRPKLQPVT